MGSQEPSDKRIIGTLMHPVINDESKETLKKSDPWQRNYFQPPPFGSNMVPRSYRLNDIRSMIPPHGHSSSDDTLKSHGFAVVKHQSALVTQLNTDANIPEDTVSRIYHAEMCDLIKRTTGARDVFVTATVLRQGKKASDQFKLPTGLAKAAEALPKHKLAVQDTVMVSAPIRLPHMDATPLGARQFIRGQEVPLRDAAVASGIIAAEDAICEPHGVSAIAKESNRLIEEGYNRDGKLGPRYAYYSVWRPLKRIERDPLALAPRRENVGEGVGQEPRGEKVYWPYLNRIKGPEELVGDFLREFAALGVEAAEEKKKEEGEEGSDSEEALKWYYVSKQEADEVLFIKLFDSAALGPDSEHASAPWHASPEIGSAQGEQLRESIELRVMAIW